MFRALEGLPAVRQPVARVALETQVEAHQLADVRLVFDDEHTWRPGLLHRPVREYERQDPSV